MLPLFGIVMFEWPVLMDVVFEPAILSDVTFRLVEKPLVPDALYIPVQIVVVT